MKTKDIQKKHEEDLERLRNFRLLDDDFMSKVFEDTACAQFLLQIILQCKDLKVRHVHVQHEVNNLQGRSITLDIFAVDSLENIYNIEVQRSDKGASRKRARYNSSLLDANITDPGDDYENLNDTYVIFITENDVLKEGIPIYHIHRSIEETGKDFEDGSHMIYVNSKIQDETELGKLMHDFWCTDADDMHYEILAERVRYFKKEEEGVRTMCKAMEDMRNEALEEGKIEGKTEERRKNIQEMLRDHVSVEKIQQYTGATKDEIKQEAKKLGSNAEV